MLNRLSSKLFSFIITVNFLIFAVIYAYLEKWEILFVFFPLAIPWLYAGLIFGIIAALIQISVIFFIGILIDKIINTISPSKILSYTMLIILILSTWGTGYYIMGKPATLINSLDDCNPDSSGLVNNRILVEDCILIVAEKKGDMDLCKKLSDVYYQASCISQIAISKGDCTLAENKYAQDKCFQSISSNIFYYAKNNNCDKLSSQSFKTLCENYQRDPEKFDICAKIADKVLQSYCLEAKQETASGHRGPPIE